MNSQETGQIKVLIVVAHDLFRKGLVNLVNGQSDFIVAGVTSSGLEAVQLARQQQIDVVLIDTIIPSETIRILKVEASVRVLALDIGSKPAEISNVLMTGADGFLMKPATPEHLYKAIRQVAKQGVLTHKLIPEGKPIEASLNSREREVLAELTKGATTVEIAAICNLSPTVVQTTINDLKEKLDVVNRTQIVARAVALGLYMPKLD